MSTDNKLLTPADIQPTKSNNNHTKSIHQKNSNNNNNDNRSGMQLLPFPSFPPLVSRDPASMVEFIQQQINENMNLLTSLQMMQDNLSKFQLRQ